MTYVGCSVGEWRAVLGGANCVAVGWQVWVSLVVSVVLFRVELILVAVVWLV